MAARFTLEVFAFAIIRAMELITILTHCHRHRGFVYQHARLTNAFSKKIENHSAAVALYMMYYNFGRKYATLGTTLAVKAGLTGQVSTVEEIAGLLEERELAAAAK